MNMKRQILFLAAIFLSLMIPAGSRAQVITYGGGRASDQQMRTLLARISTETATFRNEVMSSANRNILNANREDRVDNLIDQFNTATTNLNNRYSYRRDMSVEVNDVLQRAATIDRFMQRNNLNYRAENAWTRLRSDLDSLARYSNVAWDWNSVPSNTYPGNSFPNSGRLDARLTGTYRLDTARSDNVSDVIDRALGNRSNTQNPNMRRNLERRLNSPEMLAIEMVNNRVSMASTLAPQVSFDADGVPHSEVNQRGRTMTTTVRSSNGSMSIQYEGERANDFTVSFTPTANGQLRVLRTVYLENQDRTVSVASVYDKLDSVARWSQVNTNYNNTTAGYPTGAFGNTFIIPNGTRLNARLENNLTTRASQPGDRFTMTVTSPYQYRGAIIEGHVASSDNSGRLTGRANMSLDFDSIRMTDGRSYRFAGLVDSVKSLNGDTVSVNNEGTIRDNNQTTKTATRAGIGAVIGAIIGAVAGGGQGAAIGATVGAGAGAGSVLIQGRDNIDLAQGSEFAITASAPTGVGPIR
jgi:hypothetical protein